MPLDRNQLFETIREILCPPVKEETAINGDMIFVAGDPGEVILRLHGNKVSVAMFAVKWEGVHLPVIKPKVWATLNWGLIPSSELVVMLENLILSIRHLRRSQFRKCEFCGNMTPPERLHNEKTCMSCAEEHLGVVH